MATDENKARKGKDAQDDADFLTEAHQRYESAWQRERDNIREAYYDLEFLVGLNQWDQPAKAARDAEGRPCLTINALPTYVRQITGDIRQMRPAIKCVPVDDHGDPKTADAMAGVIRYIENRSKAQTAVYAKTADSQVSCGVGHWRVRAEYSSPSTFNQDLKLETIEDGVSVLWDPDATELSRADAKFCFVPVDMSRAGFKAKFPGKTPESYGSETYASQMTDWLTDDHVRVAEYWYKKPAKHKLVLLKDGSVFDLSDSNPKRAEEAALIVEQARAAGMIEREDERDVDEVWRCVISCSEVLEGPEKHPGRYIPIVPVWGNQITIGRKVVRFGAIRYARDPQRMYNYSRSAQTEVVALQPKAPFIGTEKNFEEHQDIWGTANTVNHPYLPYTPDPANGNQAPQRVQPAVSSTGLSQEIQLAHDDIQRTIGIFNSGLGAPSTEHSGKAILAKQREGDIGSFVYVDNFSFAIQHTGTILVDLIPHIYDTARTLRITGEDGKTEELKVNQPQGVAFDGQAEMVMNDLTVGAYDVVMSMGPSYTTRREEARDGMRELLQTNPQALPAIGDLYVKAQDWPMADEMAERFRLLAPPQIQAVIQAESDKPIPQPPPDPMQEMAAQIELKTKDAERELTEQKARETKAKADKAEAEALAIMAPLQIDPAAVEQRFALLEHLLGQIGQAISAPPMPPEPPEMPPGGPMPPEMEQYPIQPQEPPPGGFFNGSTDPGAPLPV
ncbi:portal protein [Microvirga alba]|uniref:Phage P22-like portal protein n=1 Tax=Microvirga alba TaxID=2791025 RepID=A0A931BNU4_9HYPH|nr:portal protein [Microvirga alba]MBF9234691.1 hypothetical protein [Microvirga alba]